MLGGDLDDLLISDFKMASDSDSDSGHFIWRGDPDFKMASDSDSDSGPNF